MFQQSVREFTARAIDRNYPDDCMATLQIFYFKGGNRYVIRKSRDYSPSIQGC